MAALFASRQPWLSRVRACAAAAAVAQGPPILNDEERLKLVNSVKWVDEVLTGEGSPGSGRARVHRVVHGAAAVGASVGPREAARGGPRLPAAPCASSASPPALPPPPRSASLQPAFGLPACSRSPTCSCLPSAPAAALPLPPAEVPYDLTPDFLHELFTKHKIDYVLHGDDPCLLPDGTDAYEHAKQLGRFKMVGAGGWGGGWGCMGVCGRPGGRAAACTRVYCSVGSRGAGADARAARVPAALAWARCLGARARPCMVPTRPLPPPCPPPPPPPPPPAQIKRTEGVSTTDIVGRMLMCSRDNARFSQADKERLTLEFSMGNGDTGGAGGGGVRPAAGCSCGDGVRP